ncbi:MAG: hypothetical protein ACYC6Y_20140 [Thermoguttaceae bacterium]
MPTRLVLAVLIFANPICCQVSGSTPPVRAEESAAGCDEAGCGCNRDDEPNPRRDRGEMPRLPWECPNCDLCQCVCAGALVAEHHVLPDPDQGTLAEVVVEAPGLGPSLLDLVKGPFAAPMACGEANVGRTARIRHASLLC